MRNDTIAQQPRSIEAANPAVIQLVQITDSHIFAEPCERLLGLNTRCSFERVSERALNNHDTVDLVLATGDLSQDESAESYIYLARCYDHFCIPTFWLPGNHDRVETLQQHFHGKWIHAEKQVLIGDWQIVLLDSTIPGEVGGSISSSQLEFLNAALRAYPDRHALVCLHHQALDSGSEWLDLKGLKDSDQLRQQLAQHDNVKGVLWGHVHQESRRSIGDVEWMSSPSSCVQFKPGSREFSTSAESPGYRHLNLYPDGRIKTAVHRVE